MKKTLKIISLVVVLAGLLLFCVGMYARHRVGQVRQSIHSTSSLLPDNPVNRGIGKALDEKISAYDAPIFFSITGGIVLVVIGVGALVYIKKRS